MNKQMYCYKITEISSLNGEPRDISHFYGFSEINPDHMLLEFECFDDIQDLINAYFFLLTEKQHLSSFTLEPVLEVNIDIQRAAEETMNRLKDKIDQMESFVSYNLRKMKEHMQSIQEMLDNTPKELDHGACGTSTGIDGSITHGQGILDENGYWEFPCYQCARESEKTSPEHRHHPFSRIYKSDTMI